jgi:hypothetical protein
MIGFVAPQNRATALRISLGLGSGSASIQQWYDRGTAMPKSPMTKGALKRALAGRRAYAASVTPMCQPYWANVERTRARRRATHARNAEPARRRGRERYRRGVDEMRAAHRMRARWEVGPCSTCSRCGQVRKNAISASTRPRVQRTSRHSARMFDTSRGAPRSQRGRMQQPWILLSSGSARLQLEGITDDPHRLSRPGSHATSNQIRKGMTDFLQMAHCVKSVLWSCSTSD